MRPEQLVSRRKQMDLTQAELAARLEVDVMTISRWERGERAIPPYLKFALDGIEYDLANLPPQEAYRRNQQIIERHQREAQERWKRMTPEEREAIDHWFGRHKEPG